MNPVIAERGVGTTTGFKQEPQPSFWERMELKISRPPPTPALFDGDRAQYLRFRANFKDQVESKLSLSDSEKMNYLLTYTTGRARKVIETSKRLPTRLTSFEAKVWSKCHGRRSFEIVRHSWAQDKGW